LTWESKRTHDRRREGFGPSLDDDKPGVAGLPTILALFLVVVPDGAIWDEVKPIRDRISDFFAANPKGAATILGASSLFSGMRTISSPR
jgi:hypothetical protein